MSLRIISSKTFFKPFEFLTQKLISVASSHGNIFAKKYYDANKFYINASLASELLNSNESIYVDTKMSVFDETISLELKKENENYIIKIREEDTLLSVIKKIIKEYKEYNRNFYFHENGIFNTKRINGELCVSMTNVKEYLGYSKSYNLVGYHTTRGNFITIDGNYATMSNLIKLIDGNHLRKPNVNFLLSHFTDETSYFAINEPSNNKRTRYSVYINVE